jgi:hypothetical protein
MGGTMRRPQNDSFKAQKSGSGAIISFRSNLFYQELLNKGRLAARFARGISRPAAPAARLSPRPKIRKNFLSFFPLGGARKKFFH